MNKHSNAIPNQNSSSLPVRKAVRLTVAGVLGTALVAYVSFRQPTRNLTLTESMASASLFEVIDTSVSNRQSVPILAEELATAQLQLDEKLSWLTVFRDDSDVQELFSGPLPGSDEVLLTELVPKLATFASHDNTYLDKAFAVLAKRVPACKGKSAIVVGTDGFCEGMSNEQHSSVQESARKLAASPTLQAVFIEGVNPANMAMLRRDLAPLGERVHFIAIGTLNQNNVAQYLEVVRESK